VRRTPGAGEPKGSSSPLNAAALSVAAYFLEREYPGSPRRNKVNRRQSVDEKLGDPYISRFTLREGFL